MALRGPTGPAAINRFNNNPADDKMSLTPAVSILKSAVGVPTDVYKMIEGKGKGKGKGNGRTMLRDVASAVCIPTSLPACAAARPLGYLAGVMDGKIEPTGPVDAARGAVTGAASPDSKVR